MSDTPKTENGETSTIRLQRSLKAALRQVKTRDVDRDDVVVDMKEAESARLEMLAEELRPIMDDIDEADQRFDFGMTRGERPRLWIDMTSFVAMGHDKRSYRFIKDTRMGRVVLAETGDMHQAADIVSEYVAEKVLERERMLEGEWVALKDKQDEASAQVATTSTKDTPGKRRKSGGVSDISWFMFGALCSLAVIGAAILLLSPSAF